MRKCRLPGLLLLLGGCCVAAAVASCGNGSSGLDIGQATLVRNVTLTMPSGSCGGPGYPQPAEPPLSGEVLDASGTKLADLQLGCVYGAGTPSGTPVTTQLFAGGTAVFEAVPEEGTLFTLRGAFEPGPLGCSKGPLDSSHCIGGASDGAACTSDADCDPGDGNATCARDPQCYATPPLEVASTTFPDVEIAACLVNVVAADAAGTLDVASGELDWRISIDTQVYLGPCPVCDVGACYGGARAGLSCAPQGDEGTSIDCPPSGADYFGGLPTELRSTTATASATADETGRFCAGQELPGAFGLLAARSVVQHGDPAGDLRNLAAHEFTQASVTCVQRSGNDAIDYYGRLPYLLAVASRGTLQLEPLP